MRFSTGLRNHILASGSLRAALNGGVINMYSGTAPASADGASPAAATLLVPISDNGGGGGLTFESAAASGLLQKSASQVWKGTVAQSGLATWFRFVSGADTGTSSPTETRVQGTVGVGGADMQITDPNLTAAADQKVDFFSIFQPE